MNKLTIFIVTVLQIVHINGFAIQPKIINGVLSNPADYPFFVDITSIWGYCDGVLINDEWILTAAHCLKRAAPFDIRLGLDANGGSADGMEIPVTIQYLHPKYSGVPLQPYDIGLIKLPREIELSQFIQPVKLLARCDDNLDNIDVVAVGNGITVLGRGIEDRLLRQANLTTMSVDESRQRLDNFDRHDLVVCVEPKLGRSTFLGDSGGPLLRRSDGSLIGLTSFTRGIEDPPEIKLSVFTRVPMFYRWISEMTGLELPKC